MQIDDEAIILSLRKYGESSGIACMLTAQNGLYKGFVRSAFGKKSRGIYQPGNLVEMTWKSRLSENLGSFTCELLQSNAAILLTCPRRLSALSSICTMIENTLPERDAAPEFYQHLIHLIELLKSNGNWQAVYIMLEVEILTNSGFGLDLSECAATGTTENLRYISPKSGRAVSEAAGEPYKNKLFTIPEFFLNQEQEDISVEEINNGLKICAYFLEKYIFTPHNTKLPAARLRFGELMREMA